MQRRTVLGASAAAIAAGATMSTIGGGAGTSAAAAPTTDHEKIKANVVAQFAGTPESNADPVTAGKRDKIISTARTRIKQMGAAGTDEIFAGVALGSSDTNLTTTFTRLTEIALATRMPGAPADLLGNADLQLRVLDAFALVHQKYYGDQESGYFGNWFNWEIGQPTQITRAFVLLEDALNEYRPELLSTFVATMDAYLRAGKDGDVDLGSRFHTGANLADITTNRIIQGALLGDDKRVAKAVSDQLTVYATVDPDNLVNNVTDGYYADGSFIQHDSVAYTGSYGKVLLQRSIQTIKILDDTAWSQADELVPVVHGWVARGFAPVIFEGWMMEIVKGRGVSRTTTGYVDALAVVEAAVDLASYETGDRATAMGGYVKYLTEISRAKVDPSSFVSPVSVVAYTALLADDSVPAANLTPAVSTYAYNAMARNVHHRPGWTFALARCSSRISKYEYMGGENLRPWFAGDGAHQLYLAGQDQTTAFGIAHQVCVSPYRLGGATAPVEERRTIPQLYGGQWYENPDHPLEFTSSSESQNHYVYFPLSTNDHSGGATQGTYAASGHVLADDVAWRDKQAGELPADFVAYKNASGVRSWFMFDEEIVALAAGITDEMSTGAKRSLTTTLDTRLAATGDDVTITGKLRSGAEVKTGEDQDVAWLHWSNASNSTGVGYVMLDSSKVDVVNEERSGSQRDVRQANPDTKITKQVFSLTRRHPAGRKESLAWAIVPNATAAELPDWSTRLKVLANTADVQAVEHRRLGITMINTFAEDGATVGVHRVDGPASVIIRRDRGQTEVSVCDPTHKGERIVVELKGRELQVSEAADEITVEPVRGGTRLIVNTRGGQGRSFAATLTGR